MAFVVNIDWKFVVALGVSACGVILTNKVTPESAEKGLTHGVDACKEVTRPSQILCKPPIWCRIEAPYRRF